MPSIHSITIQPLDQRYDQRLERFIRQPVEAAKLVADFGLEGDQKARQNSSRQLNLLDTAWVQQRAAQGFNPEPGQFGEQLILEGIEVLNISSGVQLKLGPLAVIQVTKPRTGCERLALVQPQAPDLTYIGVLAKVITGGAIQVGDTVELA